MADYNIRGVVNSTFSLDRAEIEITFQTDQGELSTCIDAQLLDALISHLQQISSDCERLDPGADFSRDEPFKIMPQVVDGFAVGAAGQTETPTHIFVSLRSCGVVRQYVLEPSKAEEIQDGLERAMRELNSSPKKMQ